MKVNIDRIPPEGLHLLEKEDVSLWELDSQDATYQGEILLDAWFSKISNVIDVKVKVDIHRKIRCSRCLEIVPEDVHQEFKFHYRINPQDTLLDIDEDIRQELILNSPLKPLCHENCKGLCPVCGINLNKQNCACQEGYITYHREEPDIER